MSQCALGGVAVLGAVQLAVAQVVDGERGDVLDALEVPVAAALAGAVTEQVALLAEDGEDTDVLGRAAEQVASQTGSAPVDLDVVAVEVGAVFGQLALVGRQEDDGAAAAGERAAVAAGGVEDALPDVGDGFGHGLVFARRGAVGSGSHRRNAVHIVTVLISKDERHVFRAFTDLVSSPARRKRRRRGVSRP